MTTFNPLASVVLSIAICGCFTLVPPSLLPLTFCLQQLSPNLPAWRQNSEPEPARRADSPPRKPARIPKASPSWPPCAPPPHHNLPARAALSKQRAAPAVQNCPAPGASVAEARALLRAASSPPPSSAAWPLPSARAHSPQPALPRRDREAFWPLRCALESRREHVQSISPCVRLEHRPRSQKLFHPEEELPLR